MSVGSGAEHDQTSDVPVRELAPAAPTPAAGLTGAVLALQRAIGNRAVGRLLARDGLAATRAPPTPARPDWSTQGAAEATALATHNRVNNELLPYMAGHRDRLVRNTAEWYSGPAATMSVEAITKRSDSAARVADPVNPAWVTATPNDAYFKGLTMNNVEFADPHMTGLHAQTDTTVYIRGHTADGTIMSLDELAGVVTHETSHYLVSQYGELPATLTDASSFDRYADEFRAYWVEYGRWGSLQGTAKADAIRAHLVGTQNDPNSGYGNFHAIYWGTSAASQAFRARVDAMTGPTGYNLTNSVRLHRLWQMLGGGGSPVAPADRIVRLIDSLPVEERNEAAASTLMTTMVTTLPRAARWRIATALRQPTSEEYVQHVNPRASGAVAALLDAINAYDPDEIKRRYTALSREERVSLQMNPAFEAYLDFHVDEDHANLRAAISSLVINGRAAQFDAMLAFIAALVQAQGDAAVATAGVAPQYVIDALGRLTDFSRWELFSGENTRVTRAGQVKGALELYVDVLPRPVAHDIRERLRA